MSMSNFRSGSPNVSHDIEAILKTLEGRDIPISVDDSESKDSDALYAENIRLQKEVDKLKLLVTEYRRDYSLLQERQESERVRYGEDLLGDIVISLLPIFESFRGLKLYSQRVNDKGMEDGVEAIKRQYIGILNRYGVKEFHLCDCPNRRAGRVCLDVSYMEVVQVINYDEMTSFPVELSSGWKLGDRVIVPIKVKMV